MGSMITYQASQDYHVNTFLALRHTWETSSQGLQSMRVKRFKDRMVQVRCGQCCFVFSILVYELCFSPDCVCLGMSGPIFGLCPTNRDWLKESSGNPKIGKDWVTAPPEVRFIALIRSALVCLLSLFHPCSNLTYRLLEGRMTLTM